MNVYEVSYKLSTHVAETDCYNYPFKNEDGTTKMKPLKDENKLNILAGNFEQAVQSATKHLTNKWKHPDTKLEIESVTKILELCDDFELGQYIDALLAAGERCDE